MAVDIANDTGVVDSAVLAEVLLLEVDSLWMVSWSESVETVVSVSITAKTGQASVNGLELVQLEGDKHVKVASTVSEVALPLLGLHLDLESAFHSGKAPLSGDDTVIELSTVVNSVSSLVGLVELDLISREMAVDGEFAVGVLATTVDLAVVAELHVLEANIGLGTELLVPASPFDLVSDTSFVVIVTVMHFLY